MYTEKVLLPWSIMKNTGIIFRVLLLLIIKCEGMESALV